MKSREETIQQILNALSGMSYRKAKFLLIEILEERIQDNSVIAPATLQAAPESDAGHPNT